MSRRVCLIYNPSAGGGRARKVLPEVEAALHREDLTFRSTATTSLDHAEELAREAVAEGEVAATLGGDGLVGRVAACAARHARGGSWRSCRAAAATTSPACSASRPSPAGRAHVVAAGTVKALDVGDVEGKTFVGIASCGFDSDANRIANEAPSRLGNLVYAYGALRALVAWTPAGFELELDGEPLRYRGWSAVAANSSAYGGGMFVAPDAFSTTGCSTSSSLASRASATSCARSPRYSRAPTSTTRASRSTAPARSRSPPTARSPCTPTATRSPTCRHRPRACPRRCACSCPPDAAAREARRRSRRGRARPPCGPGRDEPPGQGPAPHGARRGGELAHRLRLGSALVSATNGKTTTAAMAAAILEGTGTRLVHNRSGANMEGGVASSLLDAAGPKGSIAGDMGLFEVDEFWLERVARGGRAARAAALQPVPRPARPLRRARDDRRPLGRRRRSPARGAPRYVLNADDPLIADLGRGRPGVTYFGVEDDSRRAAGHAARLGLQALPPLRRPYAYEAAYLAHLGRYACPSCGATRPAPDVAAHAIELHGVHGASFTLRAGGREARIELPLPGLYNVYNALGAAALA